MKDWLNNRKGKQMHLTQLNAFTDEKHRLYFYATDRNNEICALIVLAQLSIENGYQVKYALDFPGAPSGTIELMIHHAMQEVASIGVTSVTFGSGALPELYVSSMNKIQSTVLRQVYKSLAIRLKLLEKSDFRKKLGAEDDPVYICYPKKGLGVSGVRSILHFFQEDA